MVGSYVNLYSLTFRGTSLVMDLCPLNVTRTLANDVLLAAEMASKSKLSRRNELSMTLLVNHDAGETGRGGT